MKIYNSNEFFYCNIYGFKKYYIDQFINDTYCNIIYNEKDNKNYFY